MERTPLGNEDGEYLQDLGSDDKYVAFPGGIPKKWLNPAFYRHSGVKPNPLGLGYRFPAKCVVEKEI